ncbi:hypothetical protein KAR91_42755 [Candidatus Pacearchaeota archaeon]|nr:hypothetical protein [Candidatus Pacearchaeota archaeon]
MAGKGEMFKLQIDKDDERIISLLQLFPLRASAAYFIECNDPIEKMEKIVTSEVGKLFRKINIVVDESLPEGSAAFVKEGKYVPKIVLAHNIKMEDEPCDSSESTLDEPKPDTSDTTQI